MKRMVRRQKRFLNMNPFNRYVFYSVSGHGMQFRASIEYIRVVGEEKIYLNKIWWIYVICVKRLLVVLKEQK